MTEAGFVKGQSDNLPLIDAFLMTAYFTSNPDFGRLKAARSEGESYGDSAVGNVQIKREKDLCVVKAQITPLDAQQKSYNVTVTCNETEGKILSVQCEGCVGGCKHAIALVTWLHRRSEDPPSTNIDCYWKTPKLSSDGTHLTSLKAKDIFNAPKTVEPKKPLSKDSFLFKVINHSKSVGNIENQLMKYYKEPSNLEMLSIHYLVTVMAGKPANADDFMFFCRNKMNLTSCHETAFATVDQNECPLWHELRYARITDSKAYEAAHCKVSDGTLTEEIMGVTKLKDSETMRSQRLSENIVLNIVEQVKKIKINKCCLILNPDYPTMCASPSGETDEYVIKIKCSSPDKTINQYITKKRKLSSKYMVQVQLQMHLSNKGKALFCIAASDFKETKDINIIEVNYDKNLCENIIEKCTSYWSTAIFPLLFRDM